ncbi:hypothetical protein KW805_00330 [Candidatus Pacearchaeota archaeon]|nr:hypothetical protein [Candidatus Pacearchaeota archaeon]
MTLNIYSHVFELPITKVETLLPSALLEEMKEFMERNTLAVSRQAGKKKIHCCTRCLKAHALKTAKEMNFLYLEKLIDRIIEAEAGHNGYYMDEDDLIKI